MAHQFRTERRVEFAETDMAGILHFANYFRYMEEAEHAFFRSLGFSVHYESDDGPRGWARGTVSCRYDRPLRYEDVVEIHLVVREKGKRSLRYEIFFVIDGDTIARGEVTTIHVGKGEDGQMQSYPMPAHVDAAIEAAPSE